MSIFVHNSKTDAVPCVVRRKTQTNGQWTEKERVKCFEKNLKKGTFQPQRVNRYVKPQGKPARWGTEWMLSYHNLVKKKKNKVSPATYHLPLAFFRMLTTVASISMSSHGRRKGRVYGQGTRRRQANLRASLLSSKWVVERTLN